MDTAEIIKFIDYQFNRLPSTPEYHAIRDFYLAQVDLVGRSKWWLLSCVVDYVNRQQPIYKTPF